MLDELSLGLDPKALKHVGESIARMVAAGKTILLVEQNVRFASGSRRRESSWRVAGILLNGCAHEVLANPEMADLYFGGSVKDAVKSIMTPA